ncbi:MAG: glycosyltransferase family 2 protein [Deltaproteobacteria bacterium]
MNSLPAADRRTATPTLSAVVPMFNEGRNVQAFLRLLHDQLAALTPSHEIVVVNDGSRDDTRDRVLEVAEACAVRYVELSRNFGKENALSAGLEAARGEVVVLLDGDGQHPPALIPEMLRHWRDGADMVYAVRAHRRDESWLKRTGTAAFYAGMAWAAHVDIPPDAGDFRLLDRKVVDALRRLPERTRFMKGLYAWVGFRSVPIEYEPPPRAGGRSSFGFGNLLRLAMAGLTSFSTLPLRLVAGVGGVISMAAIGYGTWVIVEDLVYGIKVPGYPTIVVSIMFFSGVQLLSLGVIGEYLGRVFEESKRRPNFLVSEEVDRGRISPGGERQGG